MTVVERLTTIGERLSDAPLKHLPPDEIVYVNQHQHPAVLILKSTRTGAGVGMMVSGPTVGLLPHLRRQPAWPTPCAAPYACAGARSSS